MERTAGDLFIKNTVFKPNTTAYLLLRDDVIKMKKIPQIICYLK